MNTSELHCEVYKCVGSDLPRNVVKKTVETVFEVLAEGLQKDGKVHIAGFGTFDIRVRKSRAVRNPRTQEMIQLDQTTSVGFRGSKELKTKISEKAELASEL